MFRRRAREPVPEDVPFFDDRTWTHFVCLVEKELRKRGVEFERLGSVVQSTNPKEMILGLTTLAQVCHGWPRLRWEEIVQTHFLNLFGEVASLDDMREFALNQDQLKVRLYPDDFASGTAHEFLVRPFAESIVAVLTVDTPTAVTVPARRDIEAWGPSEEDLFAMAYANTKAETEELRDSVTAFELDQGVVVSAVLGDSFFTATAVLWLDDILGPLPSEGALVALPHRHMILIHELRDIGAIRAVNHLIPMARKYFDEGPGSLSRHLYWWRDGVIRWLPASWEEGSIKFFPPADFVAALETLPPVR